MRPETEDVGDCTGVMSLKILVLGNVLTLT